MNAVAFFILGLILGLVLSIISILLLVAASRKPESPAEDEHKVDWRITGDW